MSSNPSELSCFRSVSFPEWEPGQRVTIVAPPPEPLEWVVIMCIYGALFGSLSGYALSVGFNDAVNDASMSFFEAFVICALPFSIIGAMHLAGGDQTEGTIDFDWQNEQLTVSRKLSTRSYAFQQLSKLIVLAEYELRGASSTNSEASKERVYNASLVAHIGNSRVPLLASNSRELIAESATNEMMPIAQQLAEHLPVELEKEEPQLRKHKKFLGALLAAPWWMWLTLLGLVLLSTCWVCWRAGVLPT